MKIGIFDSGIGGLSVLHEAFHLLPDQEYIFYADTDHVPYGLKTPEEIRGYAKEIVEFLIAKGVDAVVVACNTATSVAIKYLRSTFSIPIIGMEPAVKPAVEGTEGKRIMVMATPVTIREDKLKDLLHRVDENHRVDLLAMPKLVEFAEKEIYESKEVYSYLDEQFSAFDLSKYCALVLGCTHFNYFKPAYRRYFDESKLVIDGNNGTIRRLASVLGLETNTDQVTSFAHPLGACGIRKMPEYVRNEPAITEDDIYSDLEQYIVTLNRTEYYFSGRSVAAGNDFERLKRLHRRLEEVRNN